MCVCYLCYYLVVAFNMYQIIAFENPDIRNHPRISPRIFDIIRKFWERVGCEKIDVRWGTRQNIIKLQNYSLTDLKKCSTVTYLYCLPHI